MGHVLRISDELYNKAETVAKIEKRSTTGQIEYWAELGKIALDNPDLSMDFIKDILTASNELADGKGILYKFGEISE